MQRLMHILPQLVKLAYYVQQFVHLCLSQSLSTGKIHNGKNKFRLKQFFVCLLIYLFALLLKQANMQKKETKNTNIGRKIQDQVKAQVATNKKSCVCVPILFFHLMTTFEFYVLAVRCYPVVRWFFSLWRLLLILYD